MPEQLQKTKTKTEESEVELEHKNQRNQELLDKADELLEEIDELVDEAVEEMVYISVSDVDPEDEATLDEMFFNYVEDLPNAEASTELMVQMLAAKVLGVTKWEFLMSLELGGCGACAATGGCSRGLTAACQQP